MTFPNMSATSNGKDGANITLSQARQKETYVNNGWKFRDSLLGPWEIKEYETFPFQTWEKMFWDYFPAEDIGIDKKDGANITDAEARQMQTYKNNTWDIGHIVPLVGEENTIWTITETVSYPFFRWQLKHKTGPPLTARKAYVHVVPVPPHGGTMHLQYGGIDQWYAFIRHLKIFDKITGLEGDEVTFEGEDKIFVDGVEYDLIASGIEDPEAIGGYSTYTTEKQRTVTLLPDRSNNVNFYYIAPNPTELVKLFIEAVDRLIKIPLFNNEPRNALKIASENGAIYSIELVDVESDAASPVRIAANGKIYALKEDKTQ